MARRLKQLAEEINRLFPRLVASVEEGYCSTDRKLCRGISRRGKGRTGTRLIVRWRNLSFHDPRSRVLDHNAAETYRRNEEVEDWLRDEAPRLVEPKPAKASP